VLLDQGLPRLLALRGELVLHAAVVHTRDDRTLLLIGDSGRGKSTLTGAFLASARHVSNDDGAVVRGSEGCVLATPLYPGLRLLPDSRERLFSALGDASRPVADYSHKRRVPLTAGKPESRVHAIVLLAPPAPRGSAPRLVRETPTQACMAMIRNGFQLDLSDTENLKVLLGKAAEAARLVPVHQLHYPRSYDLLPDVIDLLESEA
jgi:energy-coupling factor transporter ATP-binding protein EcfA2